MGNDDRGAWSFCLPVKFIFAPGGVIMSYFKGKKIPEGATHFWEVEGIFYKKINGHWYFFVRDCWSLSISADDLGFESKLTELPTQPIGQSYMPKDGEECEATWGNKAKWLLSVTAGDFLFTKRTNNWGRFLISDLNEVEFRPLKTERDKLIESIIQDSSIESEDGSCVMMLDKPTAERLIDSGWRPEKQV